MKWGSGLRAGPARLGLPFLEAVETGAGLEALVARGGRRACGAPRGAPAGSPQARLTVNRCRVAS